MLIAICFSLLLTYSCKKVDFEDERNNLENSNQDAYSNPLSSDVPCNGYSELCNKQYDKILFPVSYRSYNCIECAGAGSDAAQLYSITNQLSNGIRGLQLNIFLEQNASLSISSGNDLFLSDSINSTNRWALVPVLNEIKDFLENNPNEVLTLFIDNNSSNKLLEEALNTAELTDYLYEHNDENAVWPVLGRMVYDNTRLVIFTSLGYDSNFPWSHPMENLIAHGRSNYESISEMNCAGSIDDMNKTFIMMHHYVKTNNSNGLNTFYNVYEQINSTSFILEQLLECTDQTQKNPNFIVLKNVHLGGFQSAINTINGI